MDINRTKLKLCIGLVLCLCSTLAVPVSAGPLKVTLEVFGNRFAMGDKIPVWITIKNQSSQSLYTSYSFLELDPISYLRVDKIADRGLSPVSPKVLRTGIEPMSPKFIILNGNTVAVEEVIEITAKQEQRIEASDLGALFNLSEPGLYKIQVRIPFRTYSRIIEKDDIVYGKIHAPDSVGSLNSNILTLRIL